MKKIIRKIKDWLIDKLGGYTKEDINLLYKSQVEVRRLLLQAWVNVVQRYAVRATIHIMTGAANTAARSVISATAGAGGLSRKS